MESQIKFRYFNAIGTLIFVLLLFACSGNKKTPDDSKTIQSKVSAEVDENSLFNGISLEGWEVTQFGPQGPVDVYDGKIILNYGDGCTGITWTKDFPKVNYEVEVEARKTTGNDFFCGITFPVQDDFCSLIVGGWGGPVVGLSCVDGEDASENETRILKRFDKDIWYAVKLKVTDKKIIAWVDDEKLVDFTYTGRELYVRPEVELSKPFGICAWITTSEIRKIRLEKISEN